jgi:hypothetical protein
MQILYEHTQGLSPTFPDEETSDAISDALPDLPGI